MKRVRDEVMQEAPGQDLNEEQAAIRGFDHEAWKGGGGPQGRKDIAAM